MNIVMVISRFYPVFGGAEKQCKTLSAELVKKGHKVTVVTQLLPQTDNHNIIEKIDVFRLGLPIKGKFGSLVFVIHAFFWLIMERDRYEILHAHIASSPSIIAGLVGKLLKKPVFLTIAGSRRTGDIYTSIQTWYGKIKLWLLKHFIDKYICLSAEIRKEMIDYGFDINKTIIMSNGVDTDLYFPAAKDEKTRLKKELGLPECKQAVIYSGRLENGKGIDLIINAWIELEKTSDTNNLLLIIGSGSLYDSLKTLSLKSKNILLLGYKENIDEYLRASDIYVLPSLGEGQPNSLLEAMSCGLACIATNIGGISEIIKNNENGFLIETGNSNAIYEILLNLFTEKYKTDKISQNACNFIRNNYSIGKISNSYQSMYKETL
jgi:glycosyltransferase involved in cell wall biosynthesis